jgi:hypothetical protein
MGSQRGKSAIPLSVRMYMFLWKKNTEESNDDFTAPHFNQDISILLFSGHDHVALTHLCFYKKKATEMVVKLKGYG